MVFRVLLFPGLLALLAHSALTNLPVSEDLFEQDAVVPESALTSIQNAGVNLQSETLKLKLCDEGSECVYKLTLSSATSESDNGQTSSQDGEITLSYELRVRATGTADTFVIDGENYVVGGKSPGDASLTSEFNDCFNKAERHVIQDANGNVQMMAAEVDTDALKESGTLTEACSAFEERIQSIYAGTVETLASVFASAGDEELMQFSERVPDANGFRTTHYRREKHADGSMTVHRARSWEHAPDRHPVPMLLQSDGTTGDSSMKVEVTGSSTSNADGVTTLSTDKADADLGADGGTAFSCQGDGTQDANGQSCDTKSVPDDKEQPEKVRIKSTTGYEITLVSMTKIEDEMLQTMTKDEFLQFHAKAGRRPVPILQAITSTEVISDPTDEEMDTGYTKFMQGLVEIGNSNPDSFEPGKLRESVHEQMRSPKVRAQTVNDLSKNKIKSARVVQSLMHAIGSAATTQPEAADQLIELASTSGIDQTAASQALVALLQAKCYDHDHAIRGLTKLARPDAQTFTQIMAVHVQHGLIAHAEHCANAKYTEASAHKYNDILAATHTHLEEAVAKGDDAAAWILLDAIGNTHSQRIKETTALVAVANNGHMRMQTRMLAVRNLGKLYTPQALVALKELAAHPMNKGTALQKACEQAISGELLAKGDNRKPLQSQVAILAQSDQVNEVHDDANGANIGIQFSKVWALPADGDIRAEPKVGIEISRETDYADTEEDPWCVHGYAGVDGKAWTWTVSLVQAGAKKCMGFKFYAYLSILQVTVWNKEKGSGESNGGGSVGDNAGDATQQLSQAGDTNGYCGTNVDAMDLSATISYDKDFLDKSKSIVVGIFVINGRIKMTGEVGLKCGWGNMGDPNSSGDHKDEARCKSGGTILFAIPYVQATLTGEMALDVLLAKGGAGVNVILVKFSLPSTNEQMEDKTCGGIIFKVEALGGTVYAFVDVVNGYQGCGWFCLERTWGRKYTVTVYEWSSPTAWTSSDVECEATDGTTNYVRAAGGDAVTAGVAFVPEVMYNDQWSPICGHYFWDNNDGADTVCDTLGFSGGKVRRTACEFGTITETLQGTAPPGSCCPGTARASGQGTCSDSHPEMYALTGFVCWTGEGNNVGRCTPPYAKAYSTDAPITYSTDAMPVGECSAGQALNSCTDGGNAWGNLEYENGYCKAGTEVGITVTCGAEDTSSTIADVSGQITETSNAGEVASIMPEVTTTDGTTNDVRAAGGDAVTAGVAFVPEVMYNGQWSPICGHYFWDNDDGAATVCDTLGFSGGTHTKTRTTYSTDAMPVGECSAGQALNSCTDGGNAWGNFEYCDEYCDEYENGYCKAGTEVGVTVTCGAEHTSSTIADFGPSPWVNFQKYPGRCGSDYPTTYHPNGQVCGKGGTGCTGSGTDETCTGFNCDDFKYCSSAGWCGKEDSRETASTKQYRCKD